MSHPTADTILRYVADQAADGEELEVEDHVAGCPGCLKRVQTLQFLRRHFDAVWGSWTPERHGEVFRRWQTAARFQTRLAGALEQLAATAGPLAARARGWYERMAREAGVAVRVLLDRPRKLALVVEEALPPGCGLEHRWSLEGVGDAEARERLEGCLSRGCEELARERVDEAARLCDEARRIDARSVQSAVGRVEREGRPVLEVVVESRRRQLVIRYWAAEGEAVPPMALLVLQDPETEVLAAEFSREAGQTCAVAEFHNVPDGAHTVSIGPADVE